MNVAFVTAEYPPESLGGAGISSRLIVDGLRERGHSVDVFALTGEPGSEAVPHDAGHMELPDGSGGLLPNGISRNVSVYRHLPDTSGYDVVHAYAPAHLPASVLRAEVPVVVTFVNLIWVCLDPQRYLKLGCPEYTFTEAYKSARETRSLPTSLVAPFIEWIGKFVTKHADAITVQTEGMREILSRCGYPYSGIDVVPNLIDPQFEIDDQETVVEDSRRLITVGRLVEEKGVFDIVRAFSELPEETRRHWELEVYGDGPQRAPIERYLDGQSVTNVSIEYCPYNEMPQKVYSGAAAVLHGAKWPEPFSRVWLEAIGMGTPIICTENPSSRCVLGDVGVFYDPFDTDSLVSALQRTIESSELRRKRSQAMQELAPQYRAANVIPEYVAIYKRI